MCFQCLCWILECFYCSSVIWRELCFSFHPCPSRSYFLHFHSMLFFFVISFGFGELIDNCRLGAVRCWTCTACEKGASFCGWCQGLSLLPCSGKQSCEYIPRDNRCDTCHPTLITCILPHLAVFQLVREPPQPMCWPRFGPGIQPALWKPCQVIIYGYSFRALCLAG